MRVGICVLSEDERDASTPSIDVLVSRVALFDRAARVATRHADKPPHLVMFGEFSFVSKAACEDDFEYMKEFCVEVPPSVCAPTDDLPRYPYLDSARTFVARASSSQQVMAVEEVDLNDTLEEGTSPFSAKSSAALTDAGGPPMRGTEGEQANESSSDGDESSSSSSSSYEAEDYSTAESCVRSIPLDFDSPDRPKVLWKVLQSICVRNDVSCLFNIPEWDFATNKLFNTSVVVSRHGNMLAKYRKKNVFFKSIFSTPTTREAACSRFRLGYPSDDHPKPSVEARKIGMMTCYDFLWSEPSRSLKNQGDLDFVLYTFMSGPAGSAFSASLRSWSLYWRMKLVACDGTGSNSQSGVFTKNGRRQAELESISLGPGFNESVDRVLTVEV